MPPPDPVQLAIDDLTDRLAAPRGSIEVVSVEEVTWRDGSIGCPQPGMRYTQALVNGSRILLRSAGVVFAYHRGGTRPPFYCANPVAPLDGVSRGGYGPI